MTAPVPGSPALPGLSDLPDEIAQARAVLDGVPGRPLAEHVPAYDEVHRLLSDALATLDGRP